MSDTLDILLDAPSLGSMIHVGSLGETRGVARFSYSDEFLHWDNAFPIDPALPLHAGMFFPAKGRETFGVFDDISPDRWGRTLIQRRAALKARDASQRQRRLSEMDYLASVQDITRQGALRVAINGQFVADDPLAAPPVTSLREIAAIAYEIGDGRSNDIDQLRRWLAALVSPGASLGGARPKANFIETDGSFWIAKFPARNDTMDVGAWEYVVHTLARQAGIDAPDAKLCQFGQEHHTFCVKRFDRTNDECRLYYASAMTLLGRKDNDTEMACYPDLAQIIQTQGARGSVQRDLEELFRRVIFNIAVSDTDDHLRNHGFLITGDGLRLAPAFDVNPNAEKLDHELNIDEIDPGPSFGNAKATADYYGLDQQSATGIIEHVLAVVSGWEYVARQVGLSRSEIESMRLCFLLTDEADANHFPREE